MLSSRLIQFREYNGLSVETVSKVIGVDKSDYCSFENGTLVPTADVIAEIADLYKVTVDELYGYNPKVTLFDKEHENPEVNPVEPKLLKMSELSWDEQELIYFYRRSVNKERIMKDVELSSEKETDGNTADKE